MSPTALEMGLLASLFTKQLCSWLREKGGAYPIAFFFLRNHLEYFQTSRPFSKVHYNEHVQLLHDTFVHLFSCYGHDYQVELLLRMSLSQACSLT